MWWYLIAVLIYISLIMSSVEASHHVFIDHLYALFAEVSAYVFCLFFAEKAMALHSSTLAWKIPWMEEPGGLQSMGSLRVRHD